MKCPKCKVEGSVLDYRIDDKGIWHWNCFECYHEWEVSAEDMKKDIESSKREKQMATDLDKLMEHRRKERCIICPYCRKEHDLSQHWEVMGKLVTYHGGEDGPVEFTCQSCDKDFWVQEHVERTFVEHKTKKEFDL